MKLLFVSGDDYCALTFEKCFKEKKVADLIENLEQCKKDFLAFDPDYAESFGLKVMDLNVDNEAFSEIVSFVGDSDFLKTVNVYPENYIFQ